MAVESLLGPVVEAPSRFRLLITHETELPAELVRRYLDIRRRIVREVGAIVAAGIEDGTFRPVDERVATFTVLEMCNWVAWWHQPADPDDLAALAASIAGMAIASLRAPGAGPAPAPRRPPRPPSWRRSAPTWTASRGSSRPDRQRTVGLLEEER